MNPLPHTRHLVKLVHLTGQLILEGYISNHSPFWNTLLLSYTLKDWGSDKHAATNIHMNTHTHTH